jgi:N-acetylglutamate synthase-like GNAT family acetyltransferase
VCHKNIVPDSFNKLANIFVTMHIEYQIISQQSPYWPQVLDIRQRLLRIPLGLNLYDEDLQAEADQYTAVALIDNQVAACLMAKVLNEQLIKFRQMAVDTIYQKKGIGARLLAYTEDYCRRQGYKHIELNARFSVAGFYIQSGYTQEGDLFEEVGISHIKMIKTI